MNWKLRTFTLTQLLMAVALLGILLGLGLSVAEAWSRRHGQTKVDHLAFSPDNRTLATTGSNGAFRLWDIQTRSLRWVREAGLTSLVFSPKGELLATGTADGTVLLWDVVAGEVTRILPGHSGPPVRREDGTLWMPYRGVDGLAFHPSGDRIVTTSGDGTLRLWELAEGSELQSLQGPAGPVSQPRFSADGRILAAKSGSGPGQTVYLWDTASWGLVGSVQHEDFILDFQLSPDGTVLLITSYDGQARHYAVPSGEELKVRETAKLFRAAFSPDGKILAAQQGDHGPIAFWDLSSGQKLGTSKRNAGYIWSQIVFSPDGTKIATGHDFGKVALWDVAETEQIVVLAGEQSHSWVFFGVLLLLWAGGWVAIRAKQKRGMVPVQP